ATVQLEDGELVSFFDALDHDRLAVDKVDDLVGERERGGAGEEQREQRQVNSPATRHAGLQKPPPRTGDGRPSGSPPGASPNNPLRPRKSRRITSLRRTQAGGNNNRLLRIGQRDPLSHIAEVQHPGPEAGGAVGDRLPAAPPRPP